MGQDPGPDWPELPGKYRANGQNGHFGPFLDLFRAFIATRGITFFHFLLGLKENPVFTGGKGVNAYEKAQNGPLSSDTRSEPGLGVINDPKSTWDMSKVRPSRQVWPESPDSQTWRFWPNLPTGPDFWPGPCHFGVILAGFGVILGWN